MNIDESWNLLSSGDKSMFQKTCRHLLKKTFIVREKDDDNRKMYLFAQRSEVYNLLDAYFSMMSFHIALDRENGLVALKNIGDSIDSGFIQANRIKLKKYETIVLLCLWTMYADRINQGTLAKGIIITLLDLKQELEKYGFREYFEKKGDMDSILTLFKQYQLIDVNGKLGDIECNIKIYPSIQFALDEEEFKRLAEKAGDRINEMRKEADSDSDLDEEEEDE